MSKRKFYVVLKGENPGIYTDWETCKKNIHGFKGSIYKSFENEEEAKLFFKEGSERVELNSEIRTDYALYVDGSYKESLGEYSYGFVLVDVKKNQALYEQYGKGDDLEARELRNVAGEMKGAMEAIRYIASKEIDEITLCYDYSGIEMWATKTWKRNNFFTESYSSYMEKMMTKIKINFYKIKGHSDDQWNDRADILAKKALGIEQ